jgi:hypothetical protein
MALRECALSWYMNFVKASVHPKSLKDIKIPLSVEFKKPKSELRCIKKLKEIKQKVIELVWEFDQLTSLSLQVEYMKKEKGKVK